MTALRTPRYPLLFWLTSQWKQEILQVLSVCKFSLLRLSVELKQWFSLFVCKSQELNWVHFKILVNQFGSCSQYSRKENENEKCVSELFIPHLSLSVAIFIFRSIAGLAQVQPHQGLNPLGLYFITSSFPKWLLILTSRDTTSSFVLKNSKCQCLSLLTMI